jgi:uncharacterized protein
VILCDTGPLVALFDAGDRDHAFCRQTLASLTQEPMRTIWACMTEAMHFLRRAGGFSLQDKLWALCDRKQLLVDGPSAKTWKRLRQLMRKYVNVPMDLADASLVVAAERTGLRRIFTLDGDFRIYLIHDQDPFNVVP